MQTYIIPNTLQNFEDNYVWEITMITVWLIFNPLIITIQFVALRATVGIRLKGSNESKGSDYHEQGMSPSIVISDNKGLLHKNYGSSMRNSLPNGTSS